LKLEDLPVKVRALIDERQKARDHKDYKESDRLRDEIKKIGYFVEDIKDGLKISLL